MPNVIMLSEVYAEFRYAECTDANVTVTNFTIVEFKKIALLHKIASIESHVSTDLKAAPESCSVLKE
jgi:hypothetical protein